MATTIDKLDLNVYNMYVSRTQALEQIKDQFHMEMASTIAPQITLVSNYPKMAELDILLGIPAFYEESWAYFTPPPQFRNARRTPFSFYRIAPTLGSQEKQDEDEEKFNAIVCETEEEKKEKSAIEGCFKWVNQINRWIGDIIGHMGQFLQG